MKRIYAYVIAIAGMVALNSCNKQQQGPPQQGPVLVSLVTVTTDDASIEKSYPASVEALNQVELRPQVSGFITGVHFTDGSYVSKGQLLYTVDDQSQKANYDQAAANVRVQQANLELAQKEAARYAYLDAHDAIAKQQVDNANARLKVAQRQVEAANAAVRGLQTNVKYTRVYAPFSGTIGISNVRTGAPVSAGMTVLNTVSSDNPIVADIAVSQTDAYHFAQLHNKGVTDNLFELYFGEEQYPHYGRIKLVDRAVNAGTGTLKVRIEFDNPDKILKAGMTGTIKIRNTQQNVIVVPYKAVNEQLGEYSVFVAGSNNKVSQRKVVLGDRMGDRIVIKEGLKAGERVVTEGNQNLMDGATITTEMPKAKATK